MDFDSLQEDSAQPQQAAPAQPAAPAEPPQSFDDLKEDPGSQPGGFDDLVDDSQKHETLGSYADAAVQSVRHGILGPFADLQDKYMPDASDNAQDSENLEAHPVINAVGNIAGLLTPGGEGALLGKAGSAASEAIGLGNATSQASKIGSTAIKSAVEMGLFQTGDEASKYILGKEDPEEPVASALTNIGAASLFGGAAGLGLGVLGQGAAKGLKAISDNRAMNGFSQLLKDAGSTWNEIYQKGASRAESLIGELNDLHGNTSDAMDEIYGASGKKSQAIKTLTENMDPSKVQDHINDVSKIIRNAPRALADDPTFQNAVSDWESKTSTQKDPFTGQTISNPSPSDTFQATDNFKRQLQEWGQYNKEFTPPSEAAWRNGAKSLATNVKGTLEDSGVWGQAGEFQKGLNKAVSDFIPANKDFLSKFTEKELGDRVISPGKVNTYVNQLGKSNAEIKQSMMQNYVESAEAFHQQFNDLHARFGLESPLKPTPLSVTKGTYGVTPPGAELAHKLNSFGINNFVTSASQHVGGGIAGYEEGKRHGGVLGGVAGAVAGGILGHFMPYVEDAAVRKIKSYAVPTVLRLLGSGKPEALIQALEHADNVQRGQSAMRLGVNSLFSGAKLTAQQAYALKAREADKEKIKKFVEGGGVTKQLQNQLQSDAQNQPQQPVAQSFAEGGAVEAQPSPVPTQVSNKPDHFSEAFPAQSMLMSAAKGRVYNYLNSIRPQPSTAKLPFDAVAPTTSKDRSYDKAVSIAASPLHIMHSMRDGSLTPEELGHFKSMWPEVHNQLSKQMTKRITEEQLKGERPSHRVRQSMSLFLGTPLDSTMTPQAIQAAQAVYMNQKTPPPNQPPTKSKKDTSKLGDVSKDYQTSTQAAEARQKGG